MQDRDLYRGRRLDNGEWVEGYHSWDSTITVNHGMDMDTGSAMWDEYEVDPSTVGQCTGLRDKNGALIWENDIINLKIGSRGRTERGIVEWHDGGFCAVTLRYEDQYTLEDAHEDIEVIGTIHTTPELMEGNER